MRLSRFSKYAWFVVVYTIGVILFGAIVRATGSGAGCGSHWPTCRGQIIPRPDQIETLIEFGHRLTSGLSGFLVLILLIWAFRLKPATNLVRRMAIMSFVFIIVEGGLGAALVRYDLVVDDASTARAIVIALHLVNTLILLGFMTLTAWAASTATDDTQLRIGATRGHIFALVLALVAFTVMSAAGAVTALGDTLFPAETLTEGFRSDFSATAHFLIRLRVWHPVIAVLTSIYLFSLGYYIQTRTGHHHVESKISVLFMLISGQIGIGIINVVLLAPIGLQIVHLLLADTMWIMLVIITIEVLTGRTMTSSDTAVFNQDRNLAAN